MTDARYPERWLTDRRLRRLSDAAHRTFVVGLAWAVSNRTDGWLTREDILLLPVAAPGKHARELVEAGLWNERDGAFEIADFSLTQTTRAQLEAAEQKRLSEADRKRKARRRESTGGGRRTDDVVPADVPRDVRKDIRADGSPVTSVRTAPRTGEARTGQDRQAVTGRVDSEDVDWPVVRIPGEVGVSVAGAVGTGKDDGAAHGVVSRPSGMRSCTVCGETLDDQNAVRCVDCAKRTGKCTDCDDPPYARGGARCWTHSVPRRGPDAPQVSTETPAAAD